MKAKKMSLFKRNLYKNILMQNSILTDGCILEKMLQKMEEEKGLMGIFHEFTNERNETFREYHMDIHEDFVTYPLTLSVRRQSQLRSTIIISQDKSVFKQYSFGQRCWFGPNGETELLPKNEGYS